MIALITSRLGVHVTTTEHKSYRAAIRAFNRAAAAGAVDSGAVWVCDGGEYGSQCVGTLGSGR